MRAKRSLGQNFLTSRAVAKDVVQAATITPEDTILEVGPGKGFLTELLLAARPKRVVVVEKDDRLIDVLHKKFADHVRSGALTIIHGDILTTDITTIVEQKPYKVVANIPYYITGELIRSFLEHARQPMLMVLMVQKEVAERIVAQDGKESILSISVKAYGEPQKIGVIPAHCFNPQPKVDSSILAIRTISRELFTHVNNELFFRIVKTGFAHKRKLLSSNLAELYDTETITKAFAACALSKNTRAEELAVSDWVCVVSAIQKKSPDKGIVKRDITGKVITHCRPH